MSARYILSEAPDLLYTVTGLDGSIVSSNELFKEYTSHIKPNTMRDLISVESELDEYIAKVKRAISKSPEPVRMYAQTRQKTGANNWNLWNIFCILGSLHFIGFAITDVTSITSHEHEKQNKLIDDIKFMLSHEFRQPLASISSLVKLLIDKGENDENHEILKMINESVVNLDKSVHSLIKKASREL